MTTRLAALAAALIGPLLAAGQDPKVPPTPSPSVPVRIVTVTPVSDPVVPAPAPVPVPVVPTPAPTPAPAPAVLSVSAGKLQILKIDGRAVTADVTWNVIQPVDAKGQRLQLVDYAAMPAGTPLFGLLEGEQFARRTSYEVDVLGVVGTGRGDGFVVVQAQTVESGAIKTLAEIPLKVVKGGIVPAPTPKPDDPKPDDPKPDDAANTSPFKEPGLRVLVLYETEELKKLTSEQQFCITGTKVRNFLEANCVTGPDGVTKEFRFWDPTKGNLKNARPVWTDAIAAKPYSELPWLYIGNGKTGYSGPLSKLDNEMIAEISKHLPKP